MLDARTETAVEIFELLAEDDLRVQGLRDKDALKKRLKVMDATAFAMCLENDMPILVFNMNKEGNIRRAVEGEKIGTLAAGEVLRLPVEDVVSNLDGNALDVGYQLKRRHDKVAVVRNASKSNNLLSCAITPKLTIV